MHTAAVSHPRSAANTHKGGQDAETPCLARARGLRQTSAHTCDREQACGAVCTACKHAHRTIRRHMTPHTTWHILPPRGVYPGDWMEFQVMVMASSYRTSCCCSTSLLLLLLSFSSYGTVQMGTLGVVPKRCSRRRPRSAYVADQGSVPRHARPACQNTASRSLVLGLQRGIAV